MTSEPEPITEAFVWTWLPGATKPVVAGRLFRVGEELQFNYGRSYLERPDAISLYGPELPLQPGPLPLLPGLSMPGCLRDGAPDAWGRRVIINRKFGKKRDAIDVTQLDELTYMLESGSDRIGALDFQRSPTAFVARERGTPTIEDLMAAAEQVEQGVPLTPELEQALFHGDSIGGARPKGKVMEGEHKFIAKFSSKSDVFDVVRGEYVAMRLAERVGLDVAPVQLLNAAGKDVLLIERFDRHRIESGWTRKLHVSALTIFGLDEMMARYASYEDLCEHIRHRFTNPGQTLRELFGRLVFNILSGNTDDHARNHAAFWDGSRLTLTPAYDICPQGRTGNEATQAMLIIGDNRQSRLSVCLDAASNFQLTREAAKALIDAQVTTIRAQWHTVCDEAQLSEIDRNLMWERQFLNPYAFEGFTQ
ncbi:HipA domain-containing protein [Asticcacaulis sp. BYS171W]|uniref:HipA domain-containing protein n=1 Tax=Asticcacaulis aquaticus TaxID=2984212 RepID=A0ABT5HSQ6_9CAUL|nr:HipA domain-containing protein [Asticcacaulis aquaticus]MDC7683102.1 HipA domain-containing protein [Asticcacaulis aquaticus]